MVCSILKFHGEQKFIIWALFRSSPYFLNQGISEILLLFILKWSRCLWILLRPCTDSSCKTHDHEAEIRKRNLHAPQLHYEDFLRKAHAVILRYTTEFSWTWMSQNEPSKAQKFSHHTPVRPPLLHPLPPSTSHLAFAKKNNFSFTRGKYFPQTEEGSASLHIHRQTHAVWMML